MCTEEMIYVNSIKDIFNSRFLSILNYYYSQFVLFFHRPQDKIHWRETWTMSLAMPVSSLSTCSVVSLASGSAHPGQEIRDLRLLLLPHHRKMLHHEHIRIQTNTNLLVLATEVTPVLRKEVRNMYFLCWSVSCLSLNV